MSRSSAPESLLSLARTPAVPRGGVRGRRSLLAFVARRRHVFADVGAVLAIALVVFLVFKPILTDAQNPPGSDIYYHLTRLDYMADEVRKGHGIPTWSPVQNLGQRFFINTGGSYPTGLYFLNLPIQLLTDDGNVTYVTSLFLIFFVMGSGFYLGFRSRFGRPAAFVGSFVAMFGPYHFVSVNVYGRWPALTALAFLPAFIAAYLNLLDRPSRASFAVAAIASGLALIAHPLILYTTLVGAGVYTMVWGVWQRVPLRRLVVAASSILVGALVFWILIPTGLTSHFFSSVLGQVGSTVADLGSEIGGRAADVGVEARPLHAISMDSFDVALRGIYTNYAGLGPLLLTLLIPILQPRRLTFAMAGVCLILYVFAFGNAGPFYSALPFIENIEPRRFLHPLYMFQGILVAAAFGPWLERIGRIRWHDHLRAGWMRLSARQPSEPRTPAQRRFASYIGPAVAVVGVTATVYLFLFDAVPMRGKLEPWPRDRWRDEAQIITDLSTGGRLLWLVDDHFAPMFYASRLAGVDTIASGGARDLASLDGFPAKAVPILALLNVRFAYADGGLVPELSKDGFLNVSRYGTPALMYNPRPPTPLQRPSRPVLLAGRSAGSYWPMILPEAMGTGGDLAALDPDYLRHFDAIVIGAYTASDSERAEAILNDFVAGGGIVFVEEGRLDGPDLWNVPSERREVPRNLEVALPSGETFQLKEFSIDGGPFVGHFYPDGGTPVLEATDLDTGDRVPLIRERRLGEGAVYYVCCNIGNHIYTTKDGAAVEVLRQFVSERVDLPESLWPEPFEADIATWEDRLIQFSYGSAEETAVVVSMRLDPAWTITVDGEETGYGPGMIVNLPAGEHTVALTYSLPVVSGFNVFVNVIGLVALAVALGPLWRFAVAEGQTPQWWARKGVGWLVARSRTTQELEEAPAPAVRAGAEIRVDTPRITRAVLYAGDPYQADPVDYEIEPESQDAVLAALTVEIENSGDDVLSFDVGEESAQITTADGSTYRPVNSVSRSRPVPRVEGRTYERFPPVWGPVSLPPASVIRGQFVFEIPRDSVVTEFMWLQGEGARRVFA